MRTHNWSQGHGGSYSEGSQEERTYTRGTYGVRGMCMGGAQRGSTLYGSIPCAQAAYIMTSDWSAGKILAEKHRTEQHKGVPGHCLTHPGSSGPNVAPASHKAWSSDLVQHLHPTLMTGVV